MRMCYLRELHMPLDLVCVFLFPKGDRDYYGEDSRQEEPLQDTNKYISFILALQRPSMNHELECNLIFQPSLNSGSILLIPVVQMGLEFISSASQGGKQLI